MSSILAKVSLSWLWQPVVVAGLIACLGLTLKAPTAAYLAEIQEAAEARREGGKRVLDILALCGNLEKVSVQGERERWISQLDEATRWLVDNWQRYALTYPNALHLQHLMAGYAGAVRGEWLSDQPLEQRVDRIRELTARVQTIYFAGRLRSAGRRPPAARELRQMIGLFPGSPS